MADRRRQPVGLIIDPVASKGSDPDESGVRRGKAARTENGPVVLVRRLHRRDLNKVWEFLKLSFRDVNLETVEYQRPRSKKRFFETYEEEGVEQLLFVVDGDIVAYTECTYEIIGSDTWINPRYFEKRDMRPLFVEELAVHPDWHGRGVGSFVLEQIQHLAKVRGLTHLVLEVAENNTHAMLWYRKRGFRKLDAAVFMAFSVDIAPELLPPRALDGTDTGEDSAIVAVADPAVAGEARARPGKKGQASRGRTSRGKQKAREGKPAGRPAKVAGGVLVTPTPPSPLPRTSLIVPVKGVLAAKPAAVAEATEPPAAVPTAPAAIAPSVPPAASSEGNGERRQPRPDTSPGATTASRPPGPRRS